MSVLEVKNLKVSFHTVMGKVEAVKGVNLQVNSGEVLGIIGESGSGKSVTSLAIMGLINSATGLVESGEILFEGRNLINLNEKEMCKVRGDKISMIFQEPMTSLNPVVTIYKQLREVYKIHRPNKKNNCKDELVELLTKLNIPDAKGVLNKYPFELSGGLKQRIMIAMAMICKPSFIIADEPTTALDVTTQSEIINLLKQIKEESNSGIMLITHDLGIIAEMAQRVAVMYYGKVVEECSINDFFDNARHPYSQDLLGAMPENFNGRFKSIEGNVPNLYEDIKGCPYYKRCKKRIQKCENSQPPMMDLNDNHRVRCFRYEKGDGK
ncbi:ABC transporter ATP-binding protein [Terrisporobacter sp.]|uniref:ABC transporter ATP-binding protein n=1 Tax=Terrisporobacter sp. TaxID=1965305 RepID=UPI002631C1D9|nr:ABC transporter ATP-binding protein [Terrisporobacter sp.]